MAPEAKAIAAVSHHEAILELCGPLVVHAVFSRAWHLRHPDGWVISVATVPYDGPLGIRVVGVELEKMLVAPGMNACLTSSELRIGRIYIDLSSGRVWRPGEDRPPLPLTRSGLHRVVSELEDAASGIGSWSPPADLRSALIHDELTAAERGAFSLLGRGPGLTPAGDDVLCGLLVGLWALGTRLPATDHWTSGMAVCLGTVVDRYAATRTTALSRTLLHHAGKGIAVQPLFDVVHTAGSNRPVSGLETLVGIGHSSGRAMLAGAILAFRAAWERGSTFGAALVRPA